MATTGKIPKAGFGAGAIKYVALSGFSANPASPPNPRIPTLGFGVNGVPRMTLLGFAPNPGATAGAFYIFGGSIIR